MALNWRKPIKHSRHYWLECDIFALGSPMEFRPVMEADLDPIGQWCLDNNCGQRMSFNQFRFSTEAEAMAFLLRWG